MRSIQEQKPATKNQIVSTKPTTDKTVNILEGYIANSMNGGILRPIAFKQIMAGERIEEYRIKGIIRMQTPKTPVAQKLKMSINTYYVPNSRVWTNAEKYTAQKGGNTNTKIKEIPNLGGKTIPFMPNSNSNVTNKINYVDTTTYRDSYISSYIPRLNTGLTSGTPDGTPFNTLPKVSVLPLRGFKAIYNDFERNKEYDEELKEYKDDIVSTNEFNTYFPDLTGEMQDGLTKKLIKCNIRGKRQNSYYTDYRTNLADTGLNTALDTTTDLMGLNEWTKKIAEARSEAENAQLNDWDIIAKIRGSKPLTEGKVQLLSHREVGLNYMAVTQNAYNVNQSITEEYQQLGAQGAYSYTELDIPLFTYQEFKEEGYIHVIAQVTADTVFETGFDRLELNVKFEDQYRPDLKDLKQDVLYDIEKCGTRLRKLEDLTKVTGYKRKYSEYFKLPNVVAGDLTTHYYNQAKIGKEQTDSYYVDENTKVLTNHTYTFFESSDRETADYKDKNIWQDYTDILINKNQAIKNTEVFLQSSNGAKKYAYIEGQNQIFMVGIAQCITEQPIDNAIKNNYTKWGEK